MGSLGCGRIILGGRTQDSRVLAKGRMDGLTDGLTDKWTDGLTEGRVILDNRRQVVEKKPNN